MHASITFSLFFRKRRPKKRWVGKYCGVGLHGYGDDEVRMSSVWEEGKTSSMASEILHGQ